MTQKEPFNKIQALLKKGVKIPNPENVHIGDDVDIEMISGSGVEIYGGCKIFGSSTFIHHEAIIGYEAPVTIENCQIGPGVQLKGGFFKDAVFLKNARAGSGAHVREGTILEEEAGIAHTVGLKQTILFPFVILGSLINFCDCLMAGGTNKKDHSEVGSSYIHFNYTPDQHKATPSLMGDVARGVMLKQKPIFLGGQGGLVGPCRLEFGTIVAAGTICRKDELRPNRLIFGGLKKEGSIPYRAGVMQGETRILKNNIIYIANLFALMQWYTEIRSQFISADFTETLHTGLKDKLTVAIKERIARLEAYYLRTIENGGKSKTTDSNISDSVLQDKERRWDHFKDRINEYAEYRGDVVKLDKFMENLFISNTNLNDYISIIQNLDNQTAEFGTSWLKEIVEHTADNLSQTLLNSNS